MPLLPSPAVLPRQPREVMISLIRGARSFGSSTRERRSIRNCKFVFTSITDRVKAGLGSLRIADGVRVNSVCTWRASARAVRLYDIGITGHLIAMGMRASRVERRYATLDARTVLSSLPSRVTQTAGKGRRTDIYCTYFMLEAR